MQTSANDHIEALKRSVLLHAESLRFLVEHLEETLRIVSPDESHKPQDDCVRKILNQCSQLGQGCMALGASINATSLAIVARALVENLILLLWIIKSPDNARRHVEDSHTELARITKINLKSGKAQIVNGKTGEDVTNQFLADERLRNLPKRVSVEERAREADVSDLYNVFYRALSMEAHGHELDDSSNEKSIEAAKAHLQGAGAILKCVNLISTSWLRERIRPDNEQLRTALGLSRFL